MADALTTTIDGDLLAILQSTGLSGIPVANIKAREMPKVTETLDSVPCVLLCPYQAIHSDPLGTEGATGRVYKRQVAVIDGTEGDFITEKDKREQWLLQCQQAIERDGTEFRITLPSAPTVWNIEIEETPTVDRPLLAKNYACSSVIVVIRSSE